METIKKVFLMVRHAASAFRLGLVLLLLRTTLAENVAERVILPAMWVQMHFYPQMTVPNTRSSVQKGYQGEDVM